MTLEMASARARARLGNEPAVRLHWPPLPQGEQPKRRALFIEPLGDEHPLGQQLVEVLVWAPNDGAGRYEAELAFADAALILYLDGVHYEVYRDGLLVECSRLF